MPFAFIVQPALPSAVQTPAHKNQALINHLLGIQNTRWEPMYMFSLVMCELIWANIANVAAILLFIAGLNVLWQHIQVACPRSA